MAARDETGPQRVVCREVVRWKDVDAQGVLNNAVYLTLFEQARWAYFAGFEVMRGQRFPFVLAASSLRFLAPGRAGDVLDVAARVTRLGNSSFAMDYAVRRGEQPLAEGDASLVWVDEELRPMRIPEPVRSRIAVSEGIDAGGGR